MSSSSFDAFAAAYDAALDDPWRRRFAAGSAFFIHQKCRAMLRHVEEDRSRDTSAPLALDVGCGIGTAVDFLATRWRIVGTDVSRKMLECASARSKLAVQEPAALPFADDTFDVVFAFCVYHHIPAGERQTHLRELVRVTRRGGRLFVFEHNPHNPVTQIVFRRAEVDRGCTMIAPRHLRRLFEAAGVVDLATRFVLFLPQPVAERVPALEHAMRRVPVGGQYFVAGRKPL
jgi:SAM-dependent methyltransferase